MRGDRRRRPSRDGCRRGRRTGSKRPRRPGGRGEARQAFVGIASVGFDSDANRIANEAPAWLGNLVYAYGALRALAAWRPARFEIELDPPGERHVFSGLHDRSRNSRTYGGGMRAAPDAMLDDGLLDVVVLESISKFRFLTKNPPESLQAARTFMSRASVYFAQRVVSISADRPFAMYADGDPIGDLPVQVRAVRGAVSVLVPADDRGRVGILLASPPRSIGSGSHRRSEHTTSD